MLPMHLLHPVCIAWACIEAARSLRREGVSRLGAPLAAVRHVRTSYVSFGLQHFGNVVVAQAGVRILRPILE